MPFSDLTIVNIGLLLFAFLGWWFGVIAAIVSRRVRYVVWAFWWCGLMWWGSVLITPTAVDPDFARRALAVSALALAVWPIAELRRRYNQAE